MMVKWLPHHAGSGNLSFFIHSLLSMFTTKWMYAKICCDKCLNCRMVLGFGIIKLLIAKTCGGERFGEDN
jgi:hypothetical protein